ncbi:MAG: glycosyltransferase family 39 protein [Candidatus Omnitrophica bacterium]|nr:glycosyltransferase family 39 protein [Candidatus Omnitrophota bacterium]
MATKSTYKLIFFLVLVLAVTCISGSLKNVQFASGADEGYYFQYASYIGQNGLQGFAGLFKEYTQNQQHWLFPNPLRIGFIILSSLWLKAFGYSFINLAYLSLFCYLLFLGVSYYFSRKYLGENLALLFVILLAFSPLQMAMARRALIESAVILFLSLAVWLFWDFLKSRSRLKFALFIAAYSLSILIKETSVLLTLVFLSFLIVDKLVCKKEFNFKEFAAILFLPFICVGLVYLVLGCLPYMPSAIKIILNSPQANTYALLFGSGPWYRYLIDYALLSPWVVILTISFIFCYFVNKETDDLPLYFIIVFLVNFILFDIFTKNLRYVIILDIPMRLFSVLMLQKIARRITWRYAIPLACMLVIGIALSDYFNFRHLFVQVGIYDPVSFLLLQAKHIIPHN